AKGPSGRQHRPAAMEKGSLHRLPLLCPSPTTKIFSVATGSPLPRSVPQPSHSPPRAKPSPPSTTEPDPAALLLSLSTAVAPSRFRCQSQARSTSTSAVRRLHHQPEKTNEGRRLLAAPPASSSPFTATRASH
ncbi:hypothetical protein Dimus_010572, partial [Dionaea muscipula]